MSFEKEQEPKALTGVRPTGELTLGNYLGALQPVVQMQDTFESPISVFVADIHGLTDQEPHTVVQSRLIAAKALIASGINPDTTAIYLQSQIEAQTLYLANLLDRHTTPAELERVPTLKDKLRDGEKAANVNLSLFRYPVLMSADIAIQDATHVPVGEDQLAHIELTRRIVRRFNNQYGDGEQVLTEPQTLSQKALRIAALNSKDGKMSKSKPNSAILLRDSPDVIAAKIKKAETALPGVMTDTLESHFTVAEMLSPSAEEKAEVAEVLQAHLDGQPVMGKFKGILTERVNNFLTSFNETFDGISDEEIRAILRKGGEKANEQANIVDRRVRDALGLTDF